MLSGANFLLSIHFSFVVLNFNCNRTGLTLGLMASVFWLAQWTVLVRLPVMYNVDANAPDAVHVLLWLLSLCFVVVVVGVDDVVVVLLWWW